MRKCVWPATVILAAVIVLSLTAACGGGGKGAATPTAGAGGQAVATATPKETAAQPAGWADIPVYSGAKSVQEWKMSLPGMTPGQEWEKVEWRYYTTKDEVGKVGDFYKSEMPKRGWRETLWMSSVEDLAWGMYTNKDENVGAGVFVMKDESENVTGIVIWRGDKKK